MSMASDAAKANIMPTVAAAAVQALHLLGPVRETELGQEGNKLLTCRSRESAPMQ